MEETKKKKKILTVILLLLFLAVVMALVWIFVINKSIVPGKAGHYTYRYADDAPDSLNPLIWDSDSEREVLSYTTSSLYAIVSGEDDTVEFLPELAAALPADVTEEYAGDEIYGVPEDASEGYAYRITIREDALWEDGTPITTADFSYSLQLYLSESSTHQSDYYNSYAALANAAAYVSDSYVSAYDSDNGYADVPDSELYFSLTQINSLFNTCSLKEYYAWFAKDNAALFIDENGHNIYEALEAAAGNEEYAAVTDEIKALLQAFCRNYGLSDEEGYKRLCFYLDEDDAVTWEEVGFVLEDDYSMVFVLTKKVDACELAYALSDLLLVQKELYESVADEYGSTTETYLSYGPYVVTSSDEEGMTLEKNENWFGYTDDAFDGQYQTTDIQIVYGLTDEEAIAKFTEGNLDNLKLGSSAADTYEGSDYLYSMSDTATDMLLMNTDLTELEKKSGNGESHTILTYKDFRHAITVAIDRTAYMQASDTDGEAAFSLIGNSYIAEISDMTTYRETSYASEILESIYGETDETGAYSIYDIEKASQLLQNAYDACLMDGNIKGTDTIVIDFYSENEGTAGYLQEALDEAAEGTSLEGKIIIRAVDNAEDADLWEKAVSGSEWDLCKYLQYFLDTDYVLGEGFPLGISKCTIILREDSVNMTYRQWYQALTQGKYRSATFDGQMKIFAYLEKGLLSSYQVIPLYSVTETYLHSQRIVFGEDEYVNSEIQYGGIRYMTYTMDDKEWARYCRQQKNKLDY